WVSPPAAFAQSNVAPTPSQTNIQLTATGSAQSGAGTEDSQLLLSFPQGAIAANPPNKAVQIDFTPLSPKQVGALPEGLVADGNVYRIQFAYVPSKAAVTTLAKPGSAVLTVPVPANALLLSSDGQTWRKLASQQANGPTQLSALLDSPGYLVAGSTRTQSQR